MFKICLTLSALISLAYAEAGYNVIPSNQVAYYHYPAPPKAQQLNGPAPNLRSSIPTPTLPPSPAFQPSSYYTSNAQPAQYNNNYQTASTVTNQFNSPALDNAAFTLALTNQGYASGATGAVNAVTTSSSRSFNNNSPALSTAQSAPAPSMLTLTSLNVKLPLPIGITPLNIAPLPLQAGTPYAAIPNAVTSYGTTYPQRKRR